MTVPTIDGRRILNKKIVNAERKPTSAGKPIAEIKKIDALSLIPKSPNEIDGIKDFTNSVNIPARRKVYSNGLLAKEAVNIPYCSAIIV